jgi:hypothetical protein
MSTGDGPIDSGPIDFGPIDSGLSPPPIPPPPPASPGPRPPYVASKPTNGFAIAALVCSLATFVFCGIGSILGIVFGHIARRQIKRSGEGGSGLALAGLIVGYVTLALGILAIVALAVFAHTFNGEAAAVSDGRSIEHQMVRLAALRGVSPRDRDVVVRVAEDTCCGEASGSNVTLGSTGVPIHAATAGDLARVGWRIDITWSSSEHACLTVPKTLRIRSHDVVAGRC